ncbi:hypothetical protein OB955_11780 [Halobacteria archaeon AArc-m2/3/4]|uniref:Uncharacterized protein n=1 Tax=Natronoglomus mannanivorans TaxID=2979990 RepID=A0ABT2QEQ9_9EURY|nr:hypothetical protein [Halobacteria archaeon AArc-m2/3/4]
MGAGAEVRRERATATRPGRRGFPPRRRRRQSEYSERRCRAVRRCFPVKGAPGECRYRRGRSDVVRHREVAQVQRYELGDRRSESNGEGENDDERVVRLRIGTLRQATVPISTGG